jgi:hypothetical protein
MFVDFSKSTPQLWELVHRHILYGAVAVLVLFVLLRRFRPGLSGIPGPTLASYTGLWRAVDVYKGHAHETGT